MNVLKECFDIKRRGDQTLLLVSVIAIEMVLDSTRRRPISDKRLEQVIGHSTVSVVANQPLCDCVNTSLGKLYPLARGPLNVIREGTGAHSRLTVDSSVISLSQQCLDNGLTITTCHSHLPPLVTHRTVVKFSILNPFVSLRCVIL